jgi:hypothetical protein
VFENRPSLIAACLTLIQAWVAQGMPKAQPVCMLGSFEDWCYSMAGIMKVIGVDGFLANRLEDLEATTSSNLEWREFVLRWGRLGSSRSTPSAPWRCTAPTTRRPRR